MFRRVASNRVKVHGNELKRCVVEVLDGVVVNYYVFSDELPLTEWIGGLIEIVPDEEGRPIAFWNGKRIQ